MASEEGRTGGRQWPLIDARHLYGSVPPQLALFNKLRSRVRLDRDDEESSLQLPALVQARQPGDFLVNEGEPVKTCCLLVEGFACRLKSTSTGQRQIVSLHLPGDLLDLQHLLVRVADHSIQCITAARIVAVPEADLRRLAEERPRIGQALWRDTLVEASRFREWIVNIGRRSAKARIAHLLCEFIFRSHAIGMSVGPVFEFPMTQDQIGDATGLTPVHVNRVLRVLAEEGIISRKRRLITVQDPTRLQDVAGFDSAYLHLEHHLRVAEVLDGVNQLDSVNGRHGANGFAAP